MSEFKKYRKKSSPAEMRPYIEGEVLPDEVRVFDTSEILGRPRVGDMIVRNPLNHNDQWWISADYFERNFEPLDESE